MVDDTAGGAHNNLCTAAQTGKLRAVGRAAVDGEHGEVVHVLGVGGEGFGNLQGQFTGRCQNEDLGVLGWAVEVHQLSHAGQRRNGECRRLAGTGLGQADNVAAFQQQRDGCGLDG